LTEGASGLLRRVAAARQGAAGGIRRFSEHYWQAADYRHRLPHPKAQILLADWRPAELDFFWHLQVCCQACYPACQPDDCCPLCLLSAPVAADSA